MGFREQEILFEGSVRLMYKVAWLYSLRIGDQTMKIKKYLVVAFLVIFCSFSLIDSAHALVNSFEAFSFHPPSDGGPYLGLMGSQSLKAWRWHFDGTAAYSHRPFQLMNGSSRSDGVIDRSIVQFFSAAVGLEDHWLELGVQLPVAYMLNFKDPNGASSQFENKMALGDLRTNLNIEFMDIDEQRFGISVVPFITFPTGKGEYYFGNGTISGGGVLVLEGRPIDRFNIVANIGAVLRKSFDFRDIVKGREIIYGIGASVGIVEGLSLIGEVGGRARLAKPFQKRLETPLEGRAGMKFAAKNGIEVTCGGGAGIFKGAGAPTFEGILGLGYTMPE